MAAKALSAYLESKILLADGVELVQILCQAAVESVEDARRYLKQGDIRARTKAINKAFAILAELTATLNHDAGGEFSRTSKALYDYMQRRLLEANFQQSDPPLAEVSKLLGTLLEGWMNCKVSAGPVASQTAPASTLPAPEPTSAYAPQEYSAYAPPAGTPAWMPPAQQPAWEPCAAPYAPPAYGSPRYSSLGDEDEESSSGQPRFAYSY